MAGARGSWERGRLVAIGGGGVFPVLEGLESRVEMGDGISNASKGGVGHGMEVAKPVGETRKLDVPF